jgi:thiamine biosynthesis protein ThiS
MITVNGKQETLGRPCTLLDFLCTKGIDPKTAVVERNGDIPDRIDWGTIMLADGDVLEVLKFMGGGAC